MDETMIERSASKIESGDNWIRNATDIREINFVVNGRNPDRREIRM